MAFGERLRRKKFGNACGEFGLVKIFCCKRNLRLNRAYCFEKKIVNDEGQKYYFC
jgi:hypothetical protein